MISPPENPTWQYLKPLLASLDRLCGLLEIHNEKIAQLINILVTVETVEPEADPDAPPTHDLSGKPIRVG